MALQRVLFHSFILREWLLTQCVNVFGFTGDSLSPRYEATNSRQDSGSLRGTKRINTRVSKIQLIIGSKNEKSRLLVIHANPSKLGIWDFALLT